MLGSFGSGSDLTAIPNKNLRFGDQNQEGLAGIHIKNARSAINLGYRQQHTDDSKMKSASLRYISSLPH